MLPAHSPVLVWLPGPEPLVECLKAALGREAMALPLRVPPRGTTVFALCADGIEDSVDVIGEPLGSAGEDGWLVLLEPTNDEGEGALLAALVAAEALVNRRASMRMKVYESVSGKHPIASPAAPASSPPATLPFGELLGSPRPCEPAAVLAEEPLESPRVPAEVEPSLFDILFEGGLTTPLVDAAPTPEAITRPNPEFSALLALTAQCNQSNDAWSPLAETAPASNDEVVALDAEGPASEAQPDPFVLGALADAFDDRSPEGVSAAREYLQGLPLPSERWMGEALLRFLAYPDAVVRTAALERVRHDQLVDRQHVAALGRILLDGDVGEVELQTAAARALACARPDARASATRVLRQVLEPKRLSLLLVLRGPAEERTYAAPVLAAVFSSLFALEGQATRPIARAAIAGAVGDRRGVLRRAFEEAQSALASN